MFKPVYPLPPPTWNTTWGNQLISLLNNRDSVLPNFPAAEGYKMATTITATRILTTSAAVADVLNVLGTLINDLKAVGVLGK